MGKDKNNSGRKGKYYTHVQPYLNIIADMCRNGKKDEDIYKRLSVSKDSFYKYKREYSELSDILKRNKDYVDSQVENELLNNALGKTIKEQKPIKLKKKYYDNNGNLCEEEYIEVVEVLREIPGDTTAQIFWLKNRRREEWRIFKPKDNQVSKSKQDKLDNYMDNLKDVLLGNVGGNNDS